MIRPCRKTITKCRILPHGSNRRLELKIDSAELNNVQTGDFCRKACNIRHNVLLGERSHNDDVLG